MALAEIIAMELRTGAVFRPASACAPQKRKSRRSSGRGNPLDLYTWSLSPLPELRFSPGELAHYETGAPAYATDRCDMPPPRAQTRALPGHSCATFACCCADPSRR